MRFRQASLQTCAEATGVVVVIDVIRAFTTAAFAFAAGAEEIILVGTVEEAFALREQLPDALAMGEVNGLPPPGFDFGNSPSALIGADLTHRRLIQRTSAGTQGAVNSHKADLLLTSSFCCAQATADYVRRISPDLVTFVVTGLGPDGRGEEDLACAEYLETLLAGERPNPEPYTKRVKECRTSRYIFADPEKPQFPWEDIECCVDVDRFDFAMTVVDRRDGLLTMKARR
ncbi:MAG: 2-phosphosulfolactate phosphatase [Anaerolineae bacterium]|nr:2-phosphosulfolactate phosphatase [Anaerolineae bacterium]